MTATSISPPAGAVATWHRRKLATTKRRVRERTLAEHRRRIAVRRRLARQHLHGTGLEIGALHIPLAVPARAHVRYVDRMTVEDLRRHYPELELCELVTPDVIDDGETLETVDSASEDFVIANHLIEHCQDPLGTIANHLRVLRSGGILYMAVPDKRLTFDRTREVTPLSHLMRDHRDGPEWSRSGHYLEWARHSMGRPPGEAEAYAEELDAQDYSIHFHVFTPDSFLEMLVHARRELSIGLEIEALERNGHEFIAILRRG